MFSNHSIRMKIVKDQKTHVVPENTTVNVINAPSNLMRDAAVGIGALYALKIAVDTSAQIALHIATNK